MNLFIRNQKIDDEGFKRLCYAIKNLKSNLSSIRLDFYA